MGSPRIADIKQIFPGFLASIDAHRCHPDLSAFLFEFTEGD